jgi:hypothetical protein
MTNKAKKDQRRAWTKPSTVCLESRAEVSAYAGVGQPWNNR